MYVSVILFSGDFMGSFKIGLASVTFRNKSVAEIVSLCQRAQVDCIEWGSDVHIRSEADAKNARALCDEAGLGISSYGSYYRVGNGDAQAWRGLCENARIMGARSIRVWLGEKDSELTSQTEYERLIRDAREICDIALGYGLLVCPECHDNTFNNNTQAILHFANELDRPNFRTYFQSRYFRKEYDLDRIEKTYNLIENIHVSYRDQKLEQAQRIKDGTYLDTLLEKFREKNFGGAVILEFSENEDEFFNDISRLKVF